MLKLRRIRNQTNNEADRWPGSGWEDPKAMGRHGRVRTPEQRAH